MSKKISKDMTIGDIIAVDRRIGMILMQNGMHCFGCGAAQYESLEEAFVVHGFDADKCDIMVDGINKFLERIEELEGKRGTEEAAT